MGPFVLFLLLAAAADASGPVPPRKSPFSPERLGNSYSYVGEAEDKGLRVEVWRNETLDREEYWYKPDPEEYFLRINETTYLRGVHDGAEWKTDPTRSLVHHDGAWRKRTAR